MHVRADDLARKVSPRVCQTHLLFPRLHGGSQFFVVLVQCLIGGYLLGVFLLELVQHAVGGVQRHSQLLVLRPDFLQRHPVATDTGRRDDIRSGGCHGQVMDGLM